MAEGRPSTAPTVDAATRPARPHPLAGQALPTVVVAAGGVLGALARYAMTSAWPHARDGFPAVTLTINVTGCFLIGILIVAVTEIWGAHRLLRPFLGVGVLGGYTTFSTSVVDARQLLADHHAVTAMGYLLGTLGGALVAVWLGMTLARLGSGARTAGWDTPDGQGATR